MNTKNRRLEFGEPQQGEGPLAAVEAQKQATSGYLWCEVTQSMTYCLLTGKTDTAWPVCVQRTQRVEGLNQGTHRIPVLAQRGQTCLGDCTVRWADTQ